MSPAASGQGVRSPRPGDGCWQAAPPLRAREGLGVRFRMPPACRLWYSDSALVVPVRFQRAHPLPAGDGPAGGGELHVVGGEYGGCGTAPFWPRPPPPPPSAPPPAPKPP